MAHDYKENPLSWDASLQDCRETYFVTWKSCFGPRFVKDGADGTVTDNLTGLVWETKTNLGDGATPPDPHDADNHYTWSEEKGPWVENGDVFTVFLEALNDGDGYAGSNGWRLPTLAELLTLLDCSGTGMVPGFPDAENNAKVPYWTATADPTVHGGCKVPSSCAWDVTFETTDGEGTVGVNGKAGGAHAVRAVRGGW